MVQKRAWSCTNRSPIDSSLKKKVSNIQSAKEQANFTDCRTEVADQAALILHSPSVLESQYLRLSLLFSFFSFVNNPLSPLWSSHIHLLVHLSQFVSTSNISFCCELFLKHSGVLSHLLN